MRIAAHLGVKDEVELIGDTIAHLRAIGVDHIVAVDGFSTDGTADVLAQHRNRDDFWFVQLDDLEPDNNEKIWLRRNLEVISNVRADWIIFLDADERWLPATGSLRDCVALDVADVLTVPRFNVVLTPNGPALPASLQPVDYGQILFYAVPIPDFRSYIQANPDTPWSRAVPGPKTMARPERIGALTDGMHDIIPNDGPLLRRHRANDLMIAHLPFTTLSRFRRKIANIQRSLSVHDEYCGDSLGWHWRRWLTLAKEGRITEEFDRQMLDAASIDALRRDGTICSATQWFSGSKDS